MKYPKLRELKEAITALIKGPYTSKFPFKPHVPFDRFRGRPYFYEEDCVGCTACAQVCPAKAIEVEDEVKGGEVVRKLTVHWDICVFCGNCEANCLTGKGIRLSREFDFATCAKREELLHEVKKEFVLCECCKEPVVPFDQYVWLTKRLGPFIFTNSSVSLFYFRELGLAAKNKARVSKNEEPSRPDRILILCPRCRREAVLKS